MKFYLSSYKLGSEPEKLVGLFSENKKVGYIPNALDFTKADPQRRENHIEKDMTGLADIGLEPELLDLKDYFGKKETLREKIRSLGGVWISGGNVFILRQAMKLSGLDALLKEGDSLKDFVYGGYSAAGCVLSPSLKSYSIVDDASELPYKEQKETIWEGLNLLEYAFLPHYNSDHPESADIEKEVQYCIENGIPYKTLKDGEAFIIE